MNPKVLITGHPNSGTSFLCNLVAEMGFSPGDRSLLKPADEHNPHGYWEHVPLQNYVRNLSGYGDWMHITGAYPPLPLDLFGDGGRWRVDLLFSGAGVEVFKETGLPVMYNLFSPSSKYLIIMRDRQAIYKSGGYEARGISYDKFCYNIEAYNRLLVDHMALETSSWAVCYEDFQTDFDNQVSGIASFLDVEPDLPRLRQIWRPRT